MAWDYPHWQYIILSRLYVANNSFSGVPCIIFLLNMENHIHAFLLLFPLTLHPFSTISSSLFFSYLNLDSLLLFFISIHFFTSFFLFFAILWCWWEHPKEGRTEVPSCWTCELSAIPCSIKGWNVTSNMLMCNTHIQKTPGGVRLVGDTGRGTSSQQVPVRLSQGPDTHHVTLSLPWALRQRLSLLSLETWGVPWAPG